MFTAAAPVPVTIDDFGDDSSDISFANEKAKSTVKIPNRPGQQEVVTPAMIRAAGAADLREYLNMKKGLIDREEDVEEVEKVMLEKGITNHESAAEYWRWMKESAAPTPSGYNPNVISKFDLSKYWKNPVMGARDEAMKALNELRKNPRPIGL